MNAQSEEPRFGEHDSPLVRFYHETVLETLVYVEQLDAEAKTSMSGAGTVIGCQRDASGNWMPLICTAGHVVRPEANRPVEYRVTRFDWTNRFKPTARRTTRFPRNLTDADAPTCIHYDGEGSDILDLALIRAPARFEDGSLFFNTGDDANATLDLTCPYENAHDWTAEGTRVAWAGFPILVEEMAGGPVPCYFEGVLSGLVLTSSVPFYLIDGHNTHGLSGGPVWALDPAAGQARIVAIISDYRSIPTESDLPGLVLASPIQPLSDYLKASGVRGRSTT